MLLSTVFKIYESILEGKLKIITEQTLMKPQREFRKVKSTQDHKEILKN